MTHDTHDRVAHSVADASGVPQQQAQLNWRRPSWLLLALVASLIGASLVVAGVVSAEVAIYVGVFGAMMLMHIGGHGHGAHGVDIRDDQSAGPAGHPRGSEDLDQARSTTQPLAPPSVAERQRSTAETPEAGETARDGHPGRGCH
jgi:hypothetical protein